MAAGASLADVYLRIHITDADVRKAAKQAGDEAGREAARGFQTTLDKELRKLKVDPIKIGVDLDLGATAKEMDELATRMREKGRETGEKTGDQISDSLSARLKRLDLPEIDLKGNPKDVLDAIDRVEARLHEIRDNPTTAQMALDAGKAFTELDRLKKALNPGIPDEAEQGAERAKTAIERKLESLNITPPRLDMDVSDALNDIDRVRSALRDLAGSDASAQVKLDAAEAMRELDRVERKLRDVDGQTATVHVKTDIDSAGIQRAISSMGSASMAASALGLAIAGLGAASSGGMVAIGALASAIVSIGLSSAAAIPAMVGLAAATGTISGAMAGPLAAFKAYQQQASAAGTASSDLGGKQKALASAQQGLADAETAGARQIQAAQEALADARVSAAEKVESAQESLKAAQDRAEEADKRYAETVRDLAAAYEEAQRALEDLNESASDRARDVEGVEISLARARERQAKVNKDAKATDLDRRDAAYDVKVAEDRLSDAIRARDRSTQDADKANKAGVAGMPQVVAANDRIAAAQKARAAAAAGVTKAEQGLAKAQADGARLVIKAQQNLARAQEDAAKNTARAKDAVASATAALTTGAKSVDKYAEAMAKLSPEGRKFVLALIDANNALGEVKKKLEAAVLPGFTDFLRSALTQAGFLGDKLAVLGGTIGNVAAKVGEFVASDRFTDRLGTMLDGVDRAAESLGSAIVPLIQAVMDIGAAATPTLERFAAWVSDIATRFALWVDAKNTAGELQEAISKAGDELSNWATALWDVMVGVFNIIKAANVGLEDFSGKSENAAASFREWTEVNTSEITRFFQMLRDVDWGSVAQGAAALAAMSLALKGISGAAGIATIFAGLGPIGIAAVAIAALVAEIAFLITASDRLTATFKEKVFPVFKEAYEWFKDRILPKLKEAADELIPRLQEALGTLGDVARRAFGDNKDDIASVADALPLVATGFGMAAEFAAKYIDVMSFMASVVTTPIGLLIDGFKAIGEGAVWLWNEAIVPAWNGIQTAITTAWDIIKAVVFDPIVAVVKGIIAPVFMWLWHEVLSPVWDGIYGLIQVAWKLIEVIFKIIEIAVRALGALFVWLYENAVKPAWQGIKDFVSAAWTALYDNILQPAWSWLKETFGPAFTWLYENAIKPAWEGIKTAISTVWEFLRDKVFSPFADFITKTLPDAFKTAVTAIGKAWDVVKQVASVPIKFIIEKVMNEGIIAGINWIAKKVGADTIDPISVPGLGIGGTGTTGQSGSGGLSTQGLATGGVLPGYTPGRDVHRFVSSTAGALELSGGEAVMRPEWTQAVGRDAVNAMNTMARTGGADAIKAFMSRLGGDAGSPLSPATIDRVLSGHSRFTRAPRLGGFADGGVIDALSGPWNSIKSLWKAGTDPAGLFKTAVDKILGKVPGLGTVKEIGVNSARKVIDQVVVWIKEKVKDFIEVLVPGGGNIGNVPIPAELEGRVNAAKDWLKKAEGTPYNYGGFGPGGFDCSGAVSAVYNIMRGVQPFAGVRFTTHNEADYMTEKGAGVLTAGWVNGGVDVAHTSGIIGGLAFEQTPPGLFVGGVRTPVSSFPNIGHPKGMAGGGVWDYIERMRGTAMMPAQALMQAPPPAISGGHRWPWGAPVSPGFWPWAGGPRRGGFANGGIFDNGGLLKPGQVGINMGGKPEAVLSPKETDNYRQMAGTDLVGVMREVRDAVREVPAGVGGHLNRSARTVNLRGKAK